MTTGADRLAVECVEREVAKVDGMAISDVGFALGPQLLEDSETLDGMVERTLLVCSSLPLIRNRMGS